MRLAPEFIPWLAFLTLNLVAFTTGVSCLQKGARNWPAENDGKSAPLRLVQLWPTITLPSSAERAVKCVFAFENARVRRVSCLECETTPPHTGYWPLLRFISFRVLPGSSVTKKRATPSPRMGLPLMKIHGASLMGLTPNRRLDDYRTRSCFLLTEACS